MFAPVYFTPDYFAPRYWPTSGSSASAFLFASFRAEPSVRGSAKALPSVQATAEALPSVLGDAQVEQPRNVLEAT